MDSRPSRVLGRGWRAFRMRLTAAETLEMTPRFDGRFGLARKTRIAWRRARIGAETLERFGAPVRRWRRTCGPLGARRWPVQIVAMTWPFSWPHAKKVRRLGSLSRHAQRNRGDLVVSATVRKEIAAAWRLSDQVAAISLQCDQAAANSLQAYSKAPSRAHFFAWVSAWPDLS